MSDEVMVRIMLAKLGDGYDQATLKLGKALLDAGFEVIYTNTQEPEAIVVSALHESVDHIGITILPGADISGIKTIVNGLAAENASEVQVSAGGIVDEQDIPKIKDMGIAAFFPQGTTFDELVDWAKKNIRPMDL